MFENTSEIFPYIVYRTDEAEAVCATWMLDNEHEALALFLDESQAKTYIQSAELSSQWQVFQPSRENLSQLLLKTYASGMRYIVLDPTANSAKRIFALDQVIENINKIEDQ